MKLLVLLLILFFPLLSSAQYPEEWLKQNVEIFRYFFNNFPSKPDVIERETKESIHCDSMGFGATLRWWILPGGTLAINTKAVMYDGKIAIAEAKVWKDYINQLPTVFERDEEIMKKFYSLFELHVDYMNYVDSEYVYTYINKSIYQKFKNKVAEALGEQTEVDLTDCNIEYNLLNNPTQNFGFYSDFDLPFLNSKTHDSDIWAIKKLMKENRLDCIKNIIRGYSIPGRMYGIAAILQLASKGEYQLTPKDKELIKKVLNLNLTVTSTNGDDLGYYIKYKECIDKELLKLLD
jgi:hypothetical protein